MSKGVSAAYSSLCVFAELQRSCCAQNAGGPWDGASGPMNGCMKGLKAKSPLDMIWSASWSAPRYMPTVPQAVPFCFSVFSKPDGACCWCLCSSGVSRAGRHSSASRAASALRSLLPAVGLRAQSDQDGLGGLRAAAARFKMKEQLCHCCNNAAPMTPKIASVTTVFSSMLASGSPGLGTSTSITASWLAGLPRMAFSLPKGTPK